MAKKVTLNEFIQRINSNYPNEQFQVLSYEGMSSPLEIQCLNCSKILKYAAAKNFFAKNKTCGCTFCQGLEAKHQKNLDIVKQKYDILEKKGRFYTCKCKNCGRISTHRLDGFLDNSCRCEGPGNHYTQEEFINTLKNYYGNEYTPMEPFNGVNNKLLFKHTCGFIWRTTPAHILYNKTGCPKCCQKQSKQCKYIEKILKSFNINYDKEAYLENSLQRFDFYFEKDNKVYAIEYNGEQHYKYIPFFHGSDIDTFKKYQERDERKAKYCKEKNIDLIIIPYTMSKTEIFALLNNLLGSTTNLIDVASSEAK